LAKETAHRVNTLRDIFWSYCPEAAQALLGNDAVAVAGESAGETFA
jgi:hypothetical protein